VAAEAAAVEVVEEVAEAIMRVSTILTTVEPARGRRLGYEYRDSGTLGQHPGADLLPWSRKAVSAFLYQAERGQGGSYSRRAVISPDHLGRRRWWRWRRCRRRRRRCWWSRLHHVSRYNSRMPEEACMVV
jgi:hypothetical protein